MEMEINRGRLTVCDSMNNLSVNEKDDITCGCGKAKTIPTGFFDFTDRSVVNYECASCGKHHIRNHYENRQRQETLGR